MAWPTTNDPRTEIVTLRLTASEADDLDALALASACTRSTAVRDAVALAVAQHKQAQPKAPAKKGKKGVATKQGPLW